MGEQEWCLTVRICLHVWLLGQGNVWSKALLKQFVLHAYYNVLPVLGHFCQNHQLKANYAKLGGAVCRGGEMGNYQLYEV